MNNFDHSHFKKFRDKYPNNHKFLGHCRPIIIIIIYPVGYIYPGVTGFRGANAKCRFYVKLRSTIVNKVNHIEIQHNIHIYTQLVYE